MNRKVFTFAIVMSLFCSASLWAEKISVEEARDAALRFLNGKRKMSAAESEALSAVQTDRLKGCYAFERKHNGGFVLVSENDATILGYADEGIFDEAEMPEGMLEYVEALSRERKLTDRSGRNPRMLKNSKGKVIVGPLVETKWAQGTTDLTGSYYNELCPEKNGQRCKVGCTALALAQIMYYYKWPKKGHGSVNYTKNGIDVAVDFSQSTYDWDNMLTNYWGYVTPNQVQILAVATLLRDVAASVKTSFGPSSSSNGSSHIPQDMADYFSYKNTAQYYYQRNMTVEEWNSLLRAELDAKRPILYSGYYENKLGHSFVCDGYDDADYFHINWGWGGSCDGYFLTTVMNPYDNGDEDECYKYYQDIVVGLEPGEESAVVLPKEQKNGCLFDLQGRSISRKASGIYIQDGKKILYHE